VGQNRVELEPTVVGGFNYGNKRFSFVILGYIIEAKMIGRMI
jgi:hypothetical protein